MNTIIRKVLSPYSQNAGEIQMTEEKRDLKYQDYILACIQ